MKLLNIALLFAVGTAAGFAQAKTPRIVLAYDTDPPLNVFTINFS